MKAYFEPKMNISVFDAAEVVTTSGHIPEQFDPDSENKTVGSVSYNDLASTTEVTASMGN